MKGTIEFESEREKRQVLHVLKGRYNIVTEEGLCLQFEGKHLLTFKQCEKAVAVPAEPKVTKRKKTYRAPVREIE